MQRAESGNLERDNRILRTLRQESPNTKSGNPTHGVELPDVWKAGKWLFYSAFLAVISFNLSFPLKAKTQTRKAATARMAIPMSGR